MILIVDSGGTKSKWVALKNGDMLSSYYFNGINVTSNPDSIKYVASLNDESQFEFQKVFFYGAGLKAKASQEKMKAELTKYWPKAEIHTITDILGAARAVSAGEKSIVSILGTGTNTGVFDGEDIVQAIPALGYLFGDPGSGFDIGKRLYSAFANKAMKESEYERFKERYIEHDSYVTDIYKQEKPNQYIAKVSHFLHYSSPELKEQILTPSFLSFFKEQIQPIANSKDYKLNFVGSIAKAFETKLRTIGEAMGYQIDKIVKDPMDGLIKYHTEQNI